METVQLKSHPMSEQAALDIDGMEGARRATGIPSMSGTSLPPDPEVPEKKPRRKYTAAYKLRLLKESIGSGGIESANKFICHVRLKRSGAWWLKSHGNGMLRLRCSLVNGTFNEAFARYVTRGIRRKNICGQTRNAPNHVASIPRVFFSKQLKYRT